MQYDIINEYISKGGHPKYIEIIEAFLKTLPNKPGMINVNNEGMISLRSAEDEKIIIDITPNNDIIKNKINITYNKSGKDNVSYSFVCVVGENKELLKFDGYVISEEGEWIMTIISNEKGENSSYIEIDYFDNEMTESYLHERIDGIPDAIKIIDSVNLETVIEIINNPEMYLKLSSELKRRTK